MMLVVGALAFFTGLFLGSTISMIIILGFIYYISMKAQRYQKMTADAIMAMQMAVPTHGVVG